MSGTLFSNKISSKKINNKLKVKQLILESKNSKLTGEVIMYNV